VAQDWFYKLDESLYLIPAGFIFDGASVPRVFRSCRGPAGVLFLAALIHDWGYHHASLARCLESGDTSSPCPHQPVPMKRCEIDRIFRDVSPGQQCMRWLSYMMVRVGGGWAWRRHRKRVLSHKIYPDA